MELELIRTYFPIGTNGTLRQCFGGAQHDNIQDHKIICYTIELPWLNNQPQVSCIPEGRYELEKRFSEHHGLHLHLLAVPKRSLILIHPANDAMKELKGCIAPVSILTAEGKGLRSRIAMEKLKEVVFPELEKGNKVYLTIKSKLHETNQ